MVTMRDSTDATWRFLSRLGESCYFLGQETVRNMGFEWGNDDRMLTQ